MDVTTIKNKIETALTVLLSASDEEQTKLASSRLEDGTAVEAEAFEVGNVLYVVSEDGEKLPAPEGTHVLESGESIVIGEEGAIVEIVTASAEGDNDEEMSAIKAELASIKEENEALKAQLSESKQNFEALEKEHSEVKLSMEATLNELKVELSQVAPATPHSPEGNGANSNQHNVQLDASLGNDALSRVNSFLS